MSSADRSAVVSVVVPTCDRRELVLRALASIESQTRRADEVILVDDGSNDSTAERVAARFPRVTILRQENRGVSAARNRGIERACGEWIAFLDSDDEWTEGKLEAQLAALAGRAERVCHTDEIWIRDGRRVNPGHRHAKRGGRLYLHSLELCAISPSAVILHRSVFERVGMFDESLPVCEDYDLWLRVTARFPVLLVEEPLVVKYGGHADQLSRSRWGLDRFRIRALERAWRELPVSPEERLATLETLRRRLSIVAGGARKRGRAGEAHRLEERAAHVGHLIDLERVAA